MMREWVPRAMQNCDDNMMALNAQWHCLNVQPKKPVQTPQSVSLWILLELSWSNHKPQSTFMGSLFPSAFVRGTSLPKYSSELDPDQSIRKTFATNLDGVVHSLEVCTYIYIYHICLFFSFWHMIFRHSLPPDCFGWTWTLQNQENQRTSPRIPNTASSRHCWRTLSWLEMEGWNSFCNSK